MKLVQMAGDKKVIKIKIKKSEEHNDAGRNCTCFYGFHDSGKKYNPSSAILPRGLYDG
jgi:hypothetical protein